MAYMLDGFYYKELFHLGKNDISDLSKSYVIKRVDNNNGLYLSSIKRINFIVGENNSGKSRFMRAIVSTKPTEMRSERILEIARASISESVDSVLVNIGEALKGELIKVCNELMSTWSLGVNLKSIVDLEYFKKEKLKEIIRYIDEDPIRTQGSVDDFVERHRRYYSEIKSKYISLFANLLVQKISQHRSEIDSLISILDNRKYFYMPSMRGFVDGFSFDNTLFESACRDRYFFSNQSVGNAVNIVTGSNLNQRMIELLLSSSANRKNFNKYELFLKEYFFNQKVELLPQRAGTEVKLRVGDSDEMPLRSLGDGFSALINMTFEAFFADSASMFCIEEPETFLHPAFQRALMKALSDEVMAKHQWFFTTHSNHFLDSSLASDDMSFIKITKDSDGIHNLEITSLPSESHLMALGVNVSSVLRANNVIWVEGINDIPYVRKMISEFAPSLRFEVDYTICILGGSMISRFEFAKNDDSSVEKNEEVSKVFVEKLCGKSFVLIDGDNALKGDRVRNLQEKLGDKLMVLPVKEMENLYPKDDLVIVLKDLVKNSAALSGNNPDGICALLEEIKFEDYAKSDVAMGKYLDDICQVKYFAQSSGAFKGSIKEKLAAHFYENVQLVNRNEELYTDLKRWFNAIPK